VCAVDIEVAVPALFPRNYYVLPLVVGERICCRFLPHYLPITGKQKHVVCSINVLFRIKYTRLLPIIFPLLFAPSADDIYCPGITHAEIVRELYKKIIFQCRYNRLLRQNSVLAQVCQLREGDIAHTCRHVPARFYQMPGSLHVLSRQTSPADEAVGEGGGCCVQLGLSAHIVQTFNFIRTQRAAVDADVVE